MKHLSFYLSLLLTLISVQSFAAELSDWRKNTEQIDFDQATYRGQLLSLEDIQTIPLIFIDNETQQAMRDKAYFALLNTYQNKGPLTQNLKSEWELLSEVVIQEQIEQMEFEYNRMALTDNLEPNELVDKNNPKLNMQDRLNNGQLDVLFASQARALLSYETQVIEFVDQFSEFYYNNFDSRSDILEMESRIREDINGDGNVAIIPQGVCGNEQTHVVIAAEWDDQCFKAKELLRELDDNLDPKWLLDDIMGHEPVFEQFLLILPELWFENPDFRPGLEFLMRVIDAQYFDVFSQSVRDARESWVHQAAGGFLMGMTIIGIASIKHPQGSRGVVTATGQKIESAATWLSSFFKKKDKKPQLLLEHLPPPSTATYVKSPVVALGPENLRRDRINSEKLAKFREAQAEQALRNKQKEAQDSIQKKQNELDQSQREIELQHQQDQHNINLQKVQSELLALEKMRPLDRISYKFFRRLRLGLRQDPLRKARQQLALANGSARQVYTSDTKKWRQVTSKSWMLSRQMLNAGFTRRSESLTSWKQRREAIAAYIKFSVGYGVFQATGLSAAYNIGFFEQLDLSPSQVLSDNLYGLAIIQNQCAAHELYEKVADTDNYDISDQQQLFQDRKKLKLIFDQWSFLSRTAKELEIADPMHYKRFNNNPVAYTKDLEFRTDYVTTSQQRSGVANGTIVGVKGQLGIGEFSCPMLAERNTDEFKNNPDGPPIIISINATKEILKYIAVTLIDAEGQSQLEDVEAEYARFRVKLDKIQESVELENNEKLKRHEEEKILLAENDDEELPQVESTVDLTVGPYEQMSNAATNKLYHLSRLYIEDNDELNEVLNGYAVNSYIETKGYFPLDAYERTDADELVDGYFASISEEINGITITTGNMSFLAEQTHYMLPPLVYNNWVLVQLKRYLATPPNSPHKAYQLAVLMTLSEVLHKQMGKKVPDVKLLKSRIDPFRVLYNVYQDTRTN